jgi:thioredoxin-like negative regulator of GroEL
LSNAPSPSHSHSHSHSHLRHCRLLQPPVTTISSVTQAIEFTEADHAVLIGFFSPENTKEFETYLTVAATFQASDIQNVAFAEVINPKVVKEFEIVYTPAVFLFRPKEDAVGFTGMFNERELADWITISTTPTLVSGDLHDMRYSLHRLVD